MNDLSALNEACALAMGWRANGERGSLALRWIAPTGQRERVIPSYVDDENDARMLEDEIERRGLDIQYAEALFRLVSGSDFLPSTRQDAWDLIRATPAQRAQAFLEAINAVGG